MARMPPKGDTLVLTVTLDTDTFKEGQKLTSKEQIIAYHRAIVATARFMGLDDARNARIDDNR